MSFLASTMVNSFQKVFDGLCSDPAEAPLPPPLQPHDARPNSSGWESKLLLGLGAESRVSGHEDRIHLVVWLLRALG